MWRRRRGIGHVVTVAEMVAREWARGTPPALHGFAATDVRRSIVLAVARRPWVTVDPETGDLAGGVSIDLPSWTSGEPVTAQTVAHVSALFSGDGWRVVARLLAVARALEDEVRATVERHGRSMPREGSVARSLRDRLARRVAGGVRPARSPPVRE